MPYNMWVTNLQELEFVLIQTVNLVSGGDQGPTEEFINVLLLKYVLSRDTVEQTPSPPSDSSREKQNQGSVRISKTYF